MKKNNIFSFFLSKKVIIIHLILVNLIISMYSNNKTYPFIYIPGMFDNGDLLTKDSVLVKNLNNTNGYYYNNYYFKNKTYDKEPFDCSSNIVDMKYNRLFVANLIGPYRTNISIWLMSDRLFCLMHGYAPNFKSYNNLTNYKGNDFEGTVTRDRITIHYRGIIEEIWAKYGTRVFYKKTNDKNRIVVYRDKMNPEKYKNLKFYINTNGYFDDPDKIKLNFIVHSSGGIALRRYMQICKKYKIQNHINIIINLSVPQKGARLVYQLKDAFPELLDDAMNNFWSNKDKKTITISNEDGKIFSYTYNELIEKSKIKIIYGSSSNAKSFRKLIGNYILYKVPFDGHKRVLGTDPMLRDLNPDHRLIKNLNNEPIPGNIKIFNFRVKSANALMFKNLSRYLKLGENDGVVDFRDTEIRDIPNGDDLIVKDYIINNVNHIPFPYIKPAYELRETISQYYGFLKILLNGNQSKEEGINILHGLFKAIMYEFGLDLKYLLENENYSVIDYFADNPVEFWD